MSAVVIKLECSLEEFGTPSGDMRPSVVFLVPLDAETPLCGMPYPWHAGVAGHEEGAGAANVRFLVESMSVDENHIELQRFLFQYHVKESSNSRVGSR